MVLTAALAGCGLVLFIEILTRYQAKAKVRPETKEVQKSTKSKTIHSNEMNAGKEGITNVESGEIERFDEKKRDLSKQSSKTILVPVKEYIE